MEKPILFNTEMVRAILDGRKTVTRRVIKPQPECVRGCADRKMYGAYESATADRTPYVFNAYVKPKYVKGDVLYVRETWSKPYGKGYYYAADYDEHDIVPSDSGNVSLSKNLIRWHPSIHMPREAARIFLLAISEHPERLQEMTEISARKEGFNDLDDARRGWNSTIEPRDLPLYGWDANPWVWVIEFDRLEGYKPNESNP